MLLLKKVKGQEVFQDDEGLVGKEDDQSASLLTGSTLKDDTAVECTEYFIETNLNRVLTGEKKRALGQVEPKALKTMSLFKSQIDELHKIKSITEWDVQTISREMQELQIKSEVAGMIQGAILGYLEALFQNTKMSVSEIRLNTAATFGLSKPQTQYYITRFLEYHNVKLKK